MARWHVPDEVGLELIGFPGKIGRSGKRPRFRFSTKQQRTTAYLAQIDAALEAAHEDHHWLHRRISAAPFSRRTPIEHMLARGMAGMADLLQSLNRAAFKNALRA